MMRHFKRALALAVGLILLAGIVLALERARGDRLLDLALERLRAANEPLRVSELLPRTPQDNAAAALIAMTNRLGELPGQGTNAPTILEFVKPGEAKPIVRGGTNWAVLRAKFQEHLDVCADLISISRKSGFNSGYEYQDGFRNIPMGPMLAAKSATRSLLWKGLSEFEAGRDGVGQKDICAALRFVEMQREPLVIFQLARLAEERLCFQATWQAVQSGSLDEDGLRELQQAWGDMDFPGDMQRALEMERAVTLEEFDQSRASGAKAWEALRQRQQTDEFLGSPDEKLAMGGAALRWINMPLWRFVWLPQDELRALQNWNEIIEFHRKAVAESWASVSGAAPAQGSATWADRFRFPISSGPFSVSSILTRNALFAQTEQQMAIATIAINRFRLRNGKLPQDLKELAPAYLNRMPRDFVGGGTLRFSVSGADFRLYSVGEDGQDNGGDPALREGEKEYFNIWKGRDAVWPKPAE